MMNPIAGPGLSPADTLLTSYLFFSLAKSTKLQPKCTDWKDVQITLKNDKQKQPTNN